MKVTYRKLDGDWVEGTCGDLWFQAKIYEVGSKYGINRSGVSKLSIRRDNKEVYHYDRGIDILSRDPKVQALKNWIVAHYATMYRRRK